MTQHEAYLNYDPFASIYDRTRVMPAAIIDSVVDLAGRTAKMKRDGLLLDAGVGTGRFGARFASAYPGRVVGVDVSTRMLEVARGKQSGVHLVRGDLLRLPFQENSFRSVFLVHILHLVERWRDVLDEARRVLEPGGVLLLGAEQGGRSILVDFYLQQARSRGISTESLGPPGLAQPLAYLRQRRPSGVLPRVEFVSGAGLTWRRRMVVAETLSLIDSRPYSQMRAIDDETHRELVELTREYALGTVGSMSAAENLDTRFVLHAIWK